MSLENFGYKCAKLVQALIDGDGDCNKNSRLILFIQSSQSSLDILRVVSHDLFNIEQFNLYSSSLGISCNNDKGIDGSRQKLCLFSCGNLLGKIYNNYLLKIKVEIINE